MKDHKWAIQSNQIKNCPVMTQDLNNVQKTWVKDVNALKGKTTRSKPEMVARDNVKVPVESLRLHKEALLMVDLFFINKMPFFLTLSRKTCFTAVNHLANQKVATIFAAFKEMHQHHLHQGFCITTLHVDGKFEPLKPVTQALPGGPMVNTTSANEHVLEIEC